MSALGRNKTIVLFPLLVFFGWCVLRRLCCFGLLLLSVLLCALRSLFVLGRSSSSAPLPLPLPPLPLPSRAC